MTMLYNSLKDTISANLVVTQKSMRLSEEEFICKDAGCSYETSENKKRLCAFMKRETLVGILLSP